ncbi:hypothetical protein H6F88_19830 [Oculatella sp. FACHB-28]|uniref:hypothetical protein n=1 Tax=Oculatella sp. FACHB-28 TaxID=2692845 RepID=UPI0016875796|nr:hypothetical protein [Oculatella sp. FACHB-28]MBD2058223.1 hypothetical protein [Oculatella sp. FACHB-28]
MSDTTAFLAGCAVTGFAAVLLLRAGLPFSSPTEMQSSPAVTEQQSPLPVPPSASGLGDSDSSQLQRELDRQRAIADALEDKLDDQETTITRLESRLQNQEDEIEQVLAQLQEQQQSVADITTRRADESSLDQNSSQSGVLWMVGGLVLVLIVGGSVVFICVIIVLLLPQRQPPRNTTHIIHQPNIPPSYPYVEQQFLPPAQPRTRRTDYIDYNG